MMTLEYIRSDASKLFQSLKITQETCYYGECYRIGFDNPKSGFAFFFLPHTSAIAQIPENWTFLETNSTIHISDHMGNFPDSNYVMLNGKTYPHAIMAFNDIYGEGKREIRIFMKRFFEFFIKYPVKLDNIFYNSKKKFDMKLRQSYKDEYLDSEWSNDLFAATLINGWTSYHAIQDTYDAFLEALFDYYQI